MYDELISELETYLSEVRLRDKIDRINVCLYLYELLIHNSDRAVELLSFFYEKANSIKSSHEKVAKIEISEVLYDDLIKQYGNVVDTLFEQILFKNLPKEQFYSQIWERIISSPVFEDKQGKAFALYYIWIDVRIPYFQLEDGLSMSNDEFRELTESLMTDIIEARFIMRTPFFSQRTARASVLLDLLNNISDRKKQAVLMSHILSFSMPDEEALKELLSKQTTDSDVVS